ncbi:MAG: hypothetical protein WA885_24015 [Phormidesmis sp.]
MTPEDITAAFSARFGQGACQFIPPDAWQIESEGIRILAISSGTWLKLMTPIMPIAEAQPFIQQMMEANFDQTQEARYAFHQEVVWGVFQYDLASLERERFDGAVNRLIALNTDGVDVFFNRMVEAQVTQIIVASKKQGQSLEATMQMLDRFYAEGMMGDMGSSDQSKGYQQQALNAWRRQLERLWPTVDAEADSK